MKKDGAIDVGDFLKPESMLTPGIAAGMVLICTSAIWVNFGIPQKYCGLFLSFLLAILVMKDLKVAFYYRAIYYVLNTLIIFSISIGGNTVGTSITQTKTSTFPNADLLLSFEDVELLETQALMEDEEFSPLDVLVGNVPNETQPILDAPHSIVTRNAEHDTTRKFFDSWF